MNEFFFIIIILTTSGEIKTSEAVHVDQYECDTVRQASSLQFLRRDDIEWFMVSKCRPVGG